MYLPSSADQALKELGQELRLARKRRRWTIAEMAEKMNVSAPTVIALEKGQSTVSTGILFSALWILGLEKELEFLIHPQDREGIELVNRRLPKAIRHSKREIKNDF